VVGEHAKSARHLVALVRDEGQDEIILAMAERVRTEVVPRQPIAVEGHVAIQRAHLGVRRCAVGLYYQQTPHQ
jgi:hypothetical protein